MTDFDKYISANEGSGRDRNYAAPKEQTRPLTGESLRQKYFCLTRLWREPAVNDSLNGEGRRATKGETLQLDGRGNSQVQGTEKGNTRIFPFFCPFFA